MDYRIEKDSLGAVAVPAHRLWGAQTQRSVENFPIGTELMPQGMIEALLTIKLAAAQVNGRLGLVSQAVAQAIEKAADDCLKNPRWDDFPLKVWQTGSGTQSNMNVNEVLAHLTSQICHSSVHPNDDVNRSQSSNDVFPSALHIATVLAAERQLLPSLHRLSQALTLQEERYALLVKIGRTHLQDATPLTLGQEISGWRRMTERCREMIENLLPFLRDLAMGGTAVGTGINAPRDFGEQIAARLTALTGTEFRSAPNKFHSLTSRDEIAAFHGVLKALAADLLKIANDVRFLASGPRCGLGELILPVNEPGSSIMPGKVNPTQCEALSMVALQVMGNDTTVGLAASQGAFELNVYLPLISHNVLQSIGLLSDAMDSFRLRCIEGMRANETRIGDLMGRSLMLVTALTPVVGYEKAAQIAHKAHQEQLTLKEAALALGALTEEAFDSLMNPQAMTGQPERKDS